MTFLEAVENAKNGDVIAYNACGNYGDTLSNTVNYGRIRMGHDYSKDALLSNYWAVLRPKNSYSEFVCIHGQEYEVIEKSQ